MHATTGQPAWELVENLGDVNPIDYGGFFVYRDTTGQYPEEAEVLMEQGEDAHGDPTSWTVYRFPLDRCTYVDGILSDNAFHPEYEAWFGEDLDGVASYLDHDSIRADLCSEDPTRRAHAYRSIGEYHGWENFDSYPLTFTDRAEVEARYSL